MSVIHFYTTSSKGSGAKQRIRNIDANVAHRLADEIIEVAIYSIKEYSYFHTKAGKEKLSPLVSKRLGIPLLLHFHWFYKLCFSLTILFLCWKYRPDYIIGEKSDCYKGLVFVKLFPKKTKLIIDFHGAVPEEYAYENPTTFDRKKYERAEKGELFLANSADYMICQSEEMKCHLSRKYGANSERISVYKCGVDMELFKILPQERIEKRKELGIDNNDMVFVYSGGMHRWQRIADTLSIFDQYHAQNVNSKMLVLTRDQKNLDRIINENNLSHLKDSIISISLTINEVPKYLNVADVAFLLRDNVVMNAVASPTKLGEYLACGLPVVTTEVANKWVVEEARDFVLNIDDVEDVNHEIDTLINHVDKKKIREYAGKHLSIEIDNQNVEQMMLRLKNA